MPVGVYARCDGPNCKEFVELKSSIGEAVPPGWAHVRVLVQRLGLPRQAMKAFHSRSCFLSWASRSESANPGDSDMDGVSDGYHTFGELYDHRRALTAALLKCNRDISWRSKAHHPDDKPMFEGYFVVGIDLPTGQISYHYKLDHWEDFHGIPIFKHAPKYDGHTPELTVERLIDWDGEL